MTAAQYAGLDLLATAVVVLDEAMRVHYANAAAEQLLQTSRRSLEGAAFGDLFLDAGPLVEKLEQAITQHWGFWDQAVTLTRPGQDSLQLNVLATPVDQPVHGVLLELRAIDQHLRIEREEQLLHQQQANRELIRNLAHEIKNPLGGLRGAAQLLELELESPELREYTQVIIKEADRLQALVDRLLAPHRKARKVAPLNIHEVCERVRMVVQSEFPETLEIHRDYDASLPEITGDKEQLIQALLNLVRNAAQAMDGRGVIELRTRVARLVTIDRKVYKLALELHVIDNGPGIPEEIRERVFFPLVSGREGGSGLGLSIAQSFVQQHGGLIDCESRPGRTDFRMLLPLA